MSKKMDKDAKKGMDKADKKMMKDEEENEKQLTSFSPLLKSLPNKQLFLCAD